MLDLAKVARTYRIISIDADPGAGDDANFTTAQIAVLKANGRNRVLSYLNLGSCETTRTYWKTAPAPYLPCGANKRAQLGRYDGYPDETWMDPSDTQYQALMVDHVAARLVARGVDGLYLDNLELLEHTPTSSNGPCSARCRQGGLDLVKRLRDRFPTTLLVMQNGTSDVTREGMTGGLSFPSLLDGVAHEEVYEPRYDRLAEEELLAWKRLNIRSRSGQPFWIAVEDYVGSCSNRAAADASSSRCNAQGFSPYASDDSARQNVVCFWGDDR
jgi:cysteinyl-tRNA synthetase